MKERLVILKKAVMATIPVMAGYLFLGVAYGILLRQNGFNWPWALLISTIVYAGSMQYALIPLMISPFSPATVIMMTLLVNARHLFYGLSMLEKYTHSGKWKIYNIFSLTDETYSLVVRGAPKGVDEKVWFPCVSVLDHCYWITGTVLGTLIGHALPFDLTGIDFAMTALFTVIATEQAMEAYSCVAKGEKKVFEAFFPAGLGFAATTLSLMVMGNKSTAFLLLAMAMMMLSFYIKYKAEERKEK